MFSKKYLILGNSHLAHRTLFLLKKENKQVVFLPEIANTILSSKSSKIEDFRSIFKDFNLSEFSIFYILFEEDNHNLEVLIALNTLFPNQKMATSLFNEKLIPHLEGAYPNVTILNPAKISATEFVNAIYENKLKQNNKQSKIKKKNNKRVKKIPKLLTVLILSFLTVITSATFYFHSYENLKLIDSFYFVIVTVTSVGYGDISLLKSTDLSKIIGIILMLSSAIFIWLILSLILDNLFKRKNEISLGRKKYNYKNHIILCGLGRLGYFIANELNEKGEKIIIIESNENSMHLDHFRRQNIAVYIGNALQHEILRDVGVEDCKALLAVTNDDYVNLEIALNARFYQENIILVLRIFDETMAMSIKEKFNIEFSRGMSYITAKHFTKIAELD